MNNCIKEHSQLSNTADLTIVILVEKEIIQKAYQAEGKDILKTLGTSLQGLTIDEAKKRYEKYGPNELSQREKLSPLKIYLEQFKNTLILVLLAAAGLIFFVYFFGERAQSDLIESILIVSIIFMITLLGFFQEYKAEKAVESLKKLLAFKAIVKRGGKDYQVDVKDLVPGDIVVLEEGEKVPADIRLLEVFNLTVSESSLTGESTPITKNTEVAKEERQINDQKNMVFSGTAIASGRGIGVVVNTGDSTEIGKIADSVAEIQRDETPIQKRLNKIGKIIGISVLVISVVVFIFIVFFADEFIELSLIQRIIHSFIASIALAVAAIPEGLPAVVTVALALGTQRMLKKNALVRKLNSIETLGSTDVIASDKTGTLTKGEMTVTEIFTDEKTYTITGTGYEEKGTFTRDEKTIDPTTLASILETGLYCNNAKKNGDGKYLGDPTEIALLISAKKASFVQNHQRVFEIPFDSERKMMTVVVKKDKDYLVYTKGAPELVLKTSSSIIHAGKKTKMTKDKEELVLSQTKKMSQKALRNLGFAHKTLTKDEYEKQKKNNTLEKDLTFLGIQGMIDPPRVEVKTLIDTCTNSGIRTIMITGDHVETAKAVAHTIGITGDAITGEELEKLSEDQLKNTVETTSIYARVSPNSKMKIVKALKTNGHIVAMTGDGVNDAPALKHADIGIAMGITGTDVAKESADMVLLDDNFSTIVAAVEEGRGIFQNIRKFVHYLLSCNIAEVMIVFLAVILFHEVPLTATMLLWINVITDGLPAVAIGMDPAEKKIMKYKPSMFQSEILSKRTWVEMIIFGIVLTVSILFLYQMHVNSDHEKAKGAVFTAIVVLELVNVYIIRSGYKTSILTNKWVHIAIATSLLLQLAIVYIPFFGNIFQVTAVSLFDWIYIAFSAVVLILVFKITDIIFDMLETKYSTQENNSLQTLAKAT